MVRYDETHGNFIPFNHDIIYSSLCINGGVLFGSENRIYKYDYQKRSFKAVCINPKGATDSDITKYRVQRIIAVSPKEVLIVTRRDGIYILNYPNMQLKRCFLLSKQYFARSMSGFKRIHIFIFLGTRPVLL